jgi:hypothetical protein
MPRNILALVTLALFFSCRALSEGTVDFSGIWKTDPARSESAHQAVPAGPITLEILQTADAITIETRTSAEDRPLIANEKLIYNLDGMEKTMPGANGAEVVCTARWKGESLVVNTLRNLNDATVATHWELSMNSNGKEITVRKTLTVQHGYQGLGFANNVGRGTDIFVKVGSPPKKSK